MKAGDATSRFVRWAGICGGLAALLLSACARQAVDLRSGADFAPPDSEAAWSRYHWYAADLSYSLSSADFTENGYSGVRSYCELRLVAKVLTPEGSQAGTIPLQGWNQAVQHMDVQLFDSSGRKQTLDRRKLDSAFHASGVLIIPRVTRGSVVAVSLKRGPFGVFQYWDIPLRMGVPVNRARVRIRYPKHLRYAFYARNGLGEPIDSSGRWVRHLTWRAERIMPIPDLPFFDAAGARPGLSMVSQYSGQAQSFRDWKSVAKYMRKERFDHTILNLRGKVERRAREICQGSVDPIANARSLLQWVQDNITPDDDARASTDPDGVLEEQRGTRWAIATMLSAMYREMGLENRIALSRAREYGGLDPQAPNPMSVWEPLVLVAVEGREWAVCPHSRQYGWGSYDPGLFGMQAMDLESGKLAPLPPSAAQRFSVEAVQELSPAAAGKRNLDLVLDGVAAMRARQEFPSGITPQACGNFLKSIGFQVVAEACTEEDLDSRDRPVRLHVKGKAGSLAVTGVAPSERLDAAFSRPAWFYDSARVEDYAFPFEQWRKETVTLRAIPGREAKLACEDRRNSVFEVKCARKPGPLGMVMTREVLIHSGNYPASSLAALHRDLSALGAATPALYSQP